MYKSKHNLEYPQIFENYARHLQLINQRQNNKGNQNFFKHSENKTQNIRTCWIQQKHCFEGQLEYEVLILENEKSLKSVT